MFSLVKQYPDIAKAWLICSFTILAISVFQPMQVDSTSFISALFEVVGIFLITGLGIVWLRFFRGPDKIGKKPPYVRVSITTWGWVWRYIVAQYIGMFVLAFFYANARDYGLLQQPSPLILYFGFFASYFIASFVIYGEKRKEKLVALLPLVRGY